MKFYIVSYIKRKKKVLYIDKRMEGIQKCNIRLECYNFLFLTYIIFIITWYVWLKESFITWTIKENKFF
jgi:hypothetical protein